LRNDEALERLNESRDKVSISTIFRGTTIQNYVKELSLADRQKREAQRIAALKIQK
jgi:cell division protein YceG involved in septum cleavage